MSCSKSSQRAVEIFSAIQFYRECATNFLHPNGIKTSQLSIPAAGLHLTGGSSLEWVDGFFAENDACQELASAIERRELPTPLISHTAHYIDSRCEYTSAELLANAPESLMAAFGVVEHLVDSALKSPTISCPQCKKNTTRVLSPLNLGDLLLRDWTSEEVTISAGSAHDSFPAWSANMGFSLQHDPIFGRPVITIDSGQCSPAFIASLSGVLRAMWKIPHITFICRSRTATQLYAPQGWCQTCRVLIAEPDRKSLTKALSVGCRCEDLSADTAALERSLMLDSALRVEDIIARPARDLQTASCKVVRELARLLVEFDLGMHPLSIGLRYLSAEHVALISIAVSLYRTRHTPSTILVDLPSGILHQRQRSMSAVSSSAQHASHTFIILGDPFAAPEHLPRPSANHSLTVAPEQVAGKANGDDSREALEDSRSDPLLNTIPLFPARPPMNRILGEDLDLIQRISQLYAASTDARCVGLSAKDFTFSASRSHKYLCRGCKGLGVTLLAHERLYRPRAKPCSLCLGARFKEPVASTLFRGVSYKTLLNQPLETTMDTLRSLPRTHVLIEGLTLLDLEHLPLGMPVALLSSSELRRVLLLKSVLSARPGHPRTIALEAPELGFARRHRDGIEALQKLPSIVDSCRWLET